MRIRQSRADDLRLFVEVLTTFCDDPRDAVEARAGEARARAQLADAQRQLEAAGTQAVEVSRGLPGRRRLCMNVQRCSASGGGCAECRAAHVQVNGLVHKGFG